MPVTDLLFRPLYAYFMIELASRRVMHVGVTRHPTDAWVAQQFREATPYGQRPKHLITDNDSKYGPLFAQMATVTGIDHSRTAYRAPLMNAICERFLGSVRRECLDYLSTMRTASAASSQLARWQHITSVNMPRYPARWLGVGQRMPAWTQRLSSRRILRRRNQPTLAHQQRPGATATDVVLQARAATTPVRPLQRLTRRHNPHRQRQQLPMTHGDNGDHQRGKSTPTA